MHHIKYGRQRWWLLLVLGLGLAGLGYRWYSGNAIRPSQPPLPQDPNIQVYFNQSQAQVYTDPYRQIERQGDDLEQVIIAAITQAQTSIDVAVQEVNLPRIAMALRDRAAAGVTVRVIVEHQYNRVWQPLKPVSGQALDERKALKYGEQQRLIDANGDGQITAQELAQGDAIRILTEADIPLLDDTADGSKGSGLMHHKFMVIDSQRVVMGSANWTLSGLHGDFAHPSSRGNANSLLSITSAELAALFTEEFALMWGDGPGQTTNSQFGVQKPQRSPRTIHLSGTAVTLQFSPVSKAQPWSQSVNGLIERTLAQAQQTVQLALFVFSDQAISDRLAVQARSGVTIQALVDENFIYRSYSEALDMLGTAIPDHRCRFEAHNYPWPSPIQDVGTPRLPDGDKLHHKFALIDDHTVIVGSHNWSAAANHTNDEDVLVIRNPTVAAHFRREFERLSRDADMGLTPSLQQRLQYQRQRCRLG